LGIFEIILFLIIALIVIPPDDLPQVMRAAGKVMRELRLASNTVMREISSAIGDEAPYNLLPPRFDDPHLPTPPSSPQPSAPAFLAPEAKPEPSTEAQPLMAESRAAAADAPQSAASDHKPELQNPSADPKSPPELPESKQMQDSEQPDASELSAAKT
jgi:hypothetical protein